MKALPPVRQYMDTTVPTLSPDVSVLDAVDFLLKKRVTGAPVVDDDGRLVGMITEKDLLRIVAHAPEPQNVAGRVADFMTREVQTVSPDMDVFYVAGLFLNVSFRRFPVVENDRIVGAITRFDILRVVRAHRERWAEYLGG
ncbi:MAG TPA: CBS domain-containing protein [Thermoanaerobaculia bacterium]|nr:CBS domain-containing protein [Thermoanaerobaculia bacterium]